MITRLTLAGALLLLLCAARVQSALIIGGLSSINGTSNSTAVASGVTYFPRGTFMVQNGGMTSTNDLRVEAQVSVDQTNYTTIAVYYPSTNAASAETFTCGVGCVTNWMRVRVVTTNAVSVGVTYQP